LQYILRIPRRSNVMLYQEVYPIHTFIRNRCSYPESLDFVILPGILCPWYSRSAV